MKECADKHAGAGPKWTLQLMVMLCCSGLFVVSFGLLVWLGEAGADYSSQLEEATIVVAHIQYRDFREEHVMRVGDEQPIHDTDYSIRLVGFVPDFIFDKETRQVRSRSPLPVNPAVKIMLCKDGEPQYEQWAFADVSTSHRVRAPGFMFQLTEFKVDQN